MTVDVDQIKAVLLAGIEELTGDAREDAARFVDSIADEIAILADRAILGDEAARISLDMLREQVMTRAYVIRLRAQGVAVDRVGFLVGVVIRAVLKTALA